MTQVNDAAKTVYMLLRFQYKPLEKRMKAKAPTLYAQYITFPYARRIAILDQMQAQGL